MKTRLLLMLAVCAIIVICGPALAHAQSAVDGFNPGTNGYLEAIAVQPDGKIVVAGAFGTLAGGARGSIGRLNADGSLDTSFNPGLGVSDPEPFTQPTVYALLVQADGKIVVGGSFKTIDGVSRVNIGRLNADGSLDTGFNPGVNGNGVEVLALQSDGKILVGGTFSILANQAEHNLGRLNPDGSVDAAFNPGANAFVGPMVVQADGQILGGGQFTMLGGGGTGTTPRKRMRRSWSGGASARCRVTTHHPSSAASTPMARRTPACNLGQRSGPHHRSAAGWQHSDRRRFHDPVRRQSGHTAAT